MRDHLNGDVGKSIIDYISIWVVEPVFICLYWVLRKIKEIIGAWENSMRDIFRGQIERRQDIPWVEYDISVGSYKMHSLIDAKEDCKWRVLHEGYLLIWRIVNLKLDETLLNEGYLSVNLGPVWTMMNWQNESAIAKRLWRLKLGLWFILDAGIIQVHRVLWIWREALFNDLCEILIILGHKFENFMAVYDWRG